MPRLDKELDRKLDLRDVILGGQDGLVNVLGIVLGVAAASGDLRIVLAAGLAATFAESFSMAAVAYTASLLKEHALADALIVGVSAIIGSLVPLLPFIFLPISTAIGVALAVSVLALFLLGIYKARVLRLNPGKEGVKIAAIGLAAAAIGYAVGLLFRNPEL